MATSQPTAELIRSPWSRTFDDLVGSAEQNLLLVSPFVKVQSARRIISELSVRGMCERVRVAALTNLRPEATLNGALDLEAFVEFGCSLPLFEVTHLPGLHAKVYVADQKLAVVSSANLMTPGMSANLEYGVALRDPGLVRQVRQDFENYARLGAAVPLADLKPLIAEANELKALFRAAERSIRRKAREAFQQKLKSARVGLLRQRAKGKSTQGLLCEAILFALDKGPLSTEELHPLVQRLQPDLCDDTIDRVIDGVHFGKRWKHHVRSAQQRLKRDGRIRYDGALWHAVPTE